MNVAVLINGVSDSDDGALWSGRIMPGKLFPLPDPTTAKIIDATGIRIAPKNEQQPQKLQVVEKKAPEPAPVVEKEKPIVITGKYIVQVGQFTAEAGVKPLIDRLNAKGHFPKVHIIQKRGKINSVQAGPYKSLEKAKESEVKLRASGMNVWVDSSDDGYIIPLTKTPMLAAAMAEMQRVAALDVQPIRLVKADEFQPVHSVYMGPYNSKDKAREVKERMSHIGLAVPTIQNWNPEK